MRELERDDDMSNATNGQKSTQRPAHELRLGTIKATVWKNQTEMGPRFSVTFARLYKKDGAWQTSQSFGRDDLLELSKLADLVHSWCHEHGESNTDGE